MKLNTRINSLRYGMFIPLALLIASLVSGCISYSDARKHIANELNDAIIALANENCGLWTDQDTIAALKHLHETTHQPLIFQASDIIFSNKALKDEAYFSLALIDRKNAAPKINGNKIVSDSIMLVPETATDGIAIQLQGFADCSIASVFAASDHTLPGTLFLFAILSVAHMFYWRHKTTGQCLTENINHATSTAPALDNIKLTPMQRKLTQMLLEAPGMQVDKTTLCTSLWGNKINAEESLYTLVKRTKNALADTDIEIICNRGYSYELRINR